MLKVLTCDEGGSVTCALLEISRALNDGPSWFEWLALGFFPMLSAFASVGVLIASLRTARSAERQAEKSEAARRQSDHDRSNNERRQRLNAALVALLNEFPRHLDDLRDWERERALGPKSVDGRISYKSLPSRPSPSPLLVRIGVAEMDASEDEMDFLSALRSAVIPPDRIDPAVLRLRLSLTTDLIVRWSRSDSEAKGWALATVRRLSRADDLQKVRAVQRQDDLVRRMESAPLNPPKVLPGRT